MADSPMKSNECRPSMSSKPPDSGAQNTVDPHEVDKHDGMQSDQAASFQPSNHSSIIIMPKYLPSISKLSREDCDLAVDTNYRTSELSKTEKLIKLSEKASCQVPNCQCNGWKGKTGKPRMFSLCSKPSCTHSLDSHISHFINADDNQINTLVGLVIDLDHLAVLIKEVFKLRQQIGCDVLEHVYISMYQELKQFLYPGSVISLHNLFGTPPFESPSIFQALRNFNMYKFGHNYAELKQAQETTNCLIRHLEDWNWVTPTKVTISHAFQYRKSYEFYYQRYIAFCEAPDYIQSITPGFRMSMIFGQDVLKFIWTQFRQFFTNWCYESSSSWSKNQCHLEMSFLSKYMDILEVEIYTIQSPLWNMHFIKSNFAKFFPFDVLDPELKKKGRNGEEKLSNEEMLLSQSNDVPVEKMLKNLNIGKTLKKVQAESVFFLEVSLGLGSSLQCQKALMEEQDVTIKFVLVGNLVNSKVDECALLWLVQLKYLFHAQFPNIPMQYISQLVFDTKNKTLALLKNNVIIGGICFRQFASQGFTEIVFCAVKFEEQGSGFGSKLMNHLKDYHIQHNILHFLAYADENYFEFFLKQGFSQDIRISERINDQDHIQYYQGAKLVHCEIDPKIVYTELSADIGFENKISEIKIKHNTLIEKPVQSIPIEGSSRVKETARMQLSRSPIYVCMSEKPYDFDVLTKKLKTVLKQVKSLCAAKPFLYPIDKNTEPDYYKIIKIPMDLSTIEERLKSGYYEHLMLFINDMRRIFLNCRKFNPPDSHRTDCANEMEVYWQAIMKEMGIWHHI